MLHNWKVSGSLLLMGVLAAPVSVRAQEVDIKEQIKKMEANLLKAFTDIRDDINVLQAKSLEAKRELDKLRTEFDEIKKTSKVALYPPNDQTIEEIKAQLKQIESRLQDLQKNQTTKRIRNAAQVRLINEYSEGLWFTINGERVFVPRNEQRVIEAESGPVSWEVASPSFNPVRGTTTVLTGGTLTLPARLPTR
jgi:hypothetical protein